MNDKKIKLVFVLLTIILHNYNFGSVLAQEVASEGFNNTLTPRLQESLASLIDTQKEFSQAVPKLGKVTKRIHYLAARINLFVVFATRHKCASGTKTIVSKLESIILRLEKKQCTDTSGTTKCIDSVTFEKFYPNIRQSFYEAKNIVQVDENKNNITDVCEK